MSLATTGAGGGLGAGAGASLSVAAMAHGGPNAAAIATTQPSHTHHQGIPGATSTTAAPGTSYAALGADLLDKNQSLLSAKSVRNVASLPIVAMDLYADTAAGSRVSYFPPMDEESNGAENGNDEMAGLMRALAKKKRGVLAKSLTGSVGLNVTLKKNDGDAYKSVKRYLNNGEGYGNVLKDAMISNADEKKKEGEEEDVVIIPRPHLLMGARRINELNPAAKSMLASLLPDEDSNNNNNNNNATPAIDQDDITKSISLTTISLDGNSSSSSSLSSQQPKGDDYDRVAYQMKLHSKKKVMTILPEEAVGLLIAQMKKNVMEEMNSTGDGKNSTTTPTTTTTTEDGEEDDEEEYMDYPPAFAIPGWAAMDSTLEGLMDAAGGRGSSCGPSLHQRSVAACVGALLPPPITATNAAAADGNNAPSKLTKLLMETMQTKDAEAQKEATRAAALSRNNPNAEPEEVVPFVPLILLVGATAEGIEISAMQISKPQGPDTELHCPFGNISVVSSVCYAHDDYLSIMESAVDEIREQIGVLLPESEEPTAIVTYGSIGTQVKLASKLKSVLTQYGKDGQGDDEWDGWDADIPIISTKEDCVSLGLAVLAASVHGRVKLVVSEKSKDGKYRPRAKLAVSVQDVATCAVAVSFNYFSGKEDKWTEPKIIFDFDRRVPAGPYQIDFTAAECAAHVRYGNKTKNANCIGDESVLMDEAKKLEGSRGIPEREEAAMNHRFRVFQRTSRNDDRWVRVGDDMKPLTMQHSQKDEGESGEDNLVAIESAVLEISLNTVGMISTRLITNGETIVQATKSKRNSKLARWGFMIGSILFIGGFLVKSYVEERIFQRDTERVLAYYKRAAPNSLHDGNEHGARYLVWKYKGKKDKLWRRLEAKYGMPVKHAWEWDDDEAGEIDGTKNDEEEAEDLDSEKTEGSEGDEL
ncbi:hypothetical protein ACHAWU_002659 [Discostella pseudostelligera]|uniref:Transmembrane protein n=1 Tax=Discostella pseudostelligera TaxID=259834 RepID=A0ABD3MRF7_9STRA